VIIETETCGTEITLEEFKGNCTRQIQSLYLDVEIAADIENFEMGATFGIDRGLRQAER